MTIELGFKVKKSDARNPDVQFKNAKAQGGVEGATHNGVIKAGVRARLFSLSVELNEQDPDAYPTVNAAAAQVFSQFWKEWKAL